MKCPPRGLLRPILRPAYVPPTFRMVVGKVRFGAFWGLAVVLAIAAIAVAAAVVAVAVAVAAAATVAVAVAAAVAVAVAVAAAEAQKEVLMFSYVLLRTDATFRYVLPAPVVFQETLGQGT
jgi:hypothetical protein